MTFETGPYQRALLVEARRAGVPVVGLMHGHISENNTHYRHNRVNASSDSENGGFTVPDITCVWADRYRKELVQSGSYPESSVKVTGNWQYDYLFSNCDKALIAKPDDFLEVGGLGSVLICTSRQDSANFIRRILEFLKSCDTTRVIVKPHPLEPHDKIEALLASDDFSFAEIYDGSIHHALNMADLVITQPSTVIFEALLLRKPVILIDPLGNKGFESVVASGACVFLQSLNELEPAVTGLLTCRDRQLALLNNLDHFRAEYFYKPGEHASAKVADAVDELIRRGPAPLAD